MAASSHSRASGSKRFLVPIIIFAIVVTAIALILYFTVFRTSNNTTAVGKWDANRILHSFNSCGYSKTIALTFDDGPHPEGTVRLMNDLAKYNIKGTFYMSPAVDAPPTQAQCDLVKQLINAGHSVQSHSYDHTDFVGKTGQQVYDNLLQNQNWINQCLGRVHTGLSIFRPPFGSLNPDYANFISKLGYTLGSWNVESLDYAGGDANTVFQNIQANFANIASGDSVITIMHDKHYITGGAVGTLDLIVPYFKNLGYTFVTAPDCYAKCNQAICGARNPVWPGTWDKIF